MEVDESGEMGEFPEVGGCLSIKNVCFAVFPEKQMN